MVSHIKLFVRNRPTTETEGYKIIDKVIQIRKDNRVYELQTDGIFYDVPQDDLYMALAPLDVIENVLNGYPVVIMAYGSSMSGKDFTLMGSNQYRNRGIMVRYASSLYSAIETLRDNNEIKVKISSLQIHGDKVFDLLHPQGIQECLVEKVSRHYAVDEEDALCLLFLADRRKEQFKRNRAKRGIPYTWLTCLTQFEVEVKPLLHLDEFIRVGSLKFLNVAGCVGVLRDPVSKEELIAREMLAVWEYSIRTRSHCSDSYKSRHHRCKLAYLLKETEYCQFIIILTVDLRKESLADTVLTLQFGNRMLHSRRTPQPPTLKIDETNLLTKLQKDVDQLTRELYAYDLFFKNKPPTNYLKLRESQLRILYNKVSVFMEDQVDDIQAENLTEVNAAYQMMRNIYRYAKEEFSRHQRVPLEGSTTPELSLETDSQTFDVESNSQLDLVKFGGELDREGFGVGTASSLSGNLATTDSKLLASAYKLKKMSLSGQSLRRYNTIRADLNFVSQKTSAPPVTFPSRAEAFEYFKKELATRLVRQLQEQKLASKLKKQRFNNLIQEIKQCNALEKRMVTQSQLGRWINEETEKQEVRHLSLKKRSLLHEARSLQSAIAILRNAQHECRLGIMQQFESWYELKLQALTYQHTLRDPNYIQHSAAATARPDHRPISITSRLMPQSQVVFEAAKQRINTWMKHSLTKTYSKFKIHSTSFDFLDKVAIS